MAALGTPLTEHGDGQSSQLSEGPQTTSAGRSRSISRLVVTPMYGLAARCKRDEGSAGATAVLHQCIRPRTWSVFHLLRATMDMRAHSISLADMSASTIWVTRFRMRRGRDRGTARATLGKGLAGSAFP